MGRREDRLAATKKPIVKRGWFWVVLLLLLGGGGYAASQFVPFDFASLLGGSSTQDTDTQDTATSTEEATTQDDIDQLLELYQSIELSDSILEDVKGSSYEDVVALLGEPSSNVDSELGESKTKMAIWNTFNGRSTISVNFKDDYASGKSASKLAIEAKNKISAEQFDAVSVDSSYTYEEAVKEFGEPDSLSNALISGVQTVTALWSTNAEQSFTIHFDDNVAVSKEQVAD